jgi:Protein of unknown function (DUF4199)
MEKNLSKTNQHHSPMAAVKKLSIPLIYGLIASLCLMGLTFATYEAGVNAFLGWVANLGKYPILIGLAIAAALTQRRQNEYYLDFRAALKTCFSIFVLALSAQTLFAWLLVNVIDPHFKQMLLIAIPERMAASYRQFGVSEDQLQIALAEEKGADPFTLGRMIQGMGFNFILHFLIALLIAAIVKSKKRPVAPQAG